MRKAIVVLVLLLLTAWLGVHFYSNLKLRAPVLDVSAMALPPGDPVRGARLGAITGCSSCHDKDLGGNDFISEPYVFALVAPDLTRVRAKYDDAAFLRLFRANAKVDGKVAIGMPTEMQQRMTDQELADVIAYVRSAPPSADPVDGSTRLLPLGRLGLVTGEFEAYVADPPESAVVLRDRAEPARGRHLALIACTECHGMDLKGGGKTPPLAIAKAYTLAQFTTLMRTGKTLAGTDSASGMMSGVARRRFAAFTDDEIADLHAFAAGSGAP
jgi:mono/diheme cytochrome c family protein